MTNEEILCTFMEPKPTTLPRDWAESVVAWPDWWEEEDGEWQPVFNFCQEFEKLGLLWEIEEQLTEQHRWEYFDALLVSLNHARFSCGPDMWPLIHATSEQKIDALSIVLGPLVQGTATLSKTMTPGGGSIKDK